MRFLLLFLATLSFSAFAQVYKWTDENGNVHFGNQPPPGQQEEVQIRESKTGSMVTDRQREMLDRIDQERAERRADSDIASTSQKPRTESSSCRKAKIILQRYENELDQLLRRGYKQSERRDAEDRVTRWESEVAYYCS
ncbi:DUF4124 domain-containing protein [Marinobacter adhaerens]|uniref:DUF4124 domain-containing protein n=2 Tax=Marinobacter adhaerens TaxID=1033846 RepID=A0ABX8IG90_9GAMM|nr:DUF4124 domain-containing protein [Marinobacter adhaerens]ADP97719.1 conserved hypothetical protein, secreted [Marinobacter adhaerens HP15]QWV11778.1 DUF4124 domain-containing protein [Marinobacter adhaerens]